MSAISVELALERSVGLTLVYRLSGDVARLRLPSLQAPVPADRLWAHTCFELFIAADRESSAYREWNFSPSGQSAQYDFNDYRIPAKTRSSVTPAIRTRIAVDGLELDVQLPWPDGFEDTTCLGLSAVIEDVDGALYYWALRHPSAKPDFHHREAFALTLDTAPPHPERTP